mgnify:CR=1 FL=1
MASSRLQSTDLTEVQGEVRLDQVIAEAVDTPEWKEAVQRNYWNPVPLSGTELEEFIAAEKERIGTLTEEIK